MVSGKLYIKDNSGNVQELKIDKERTVEFIRGTQTAAGAALTGATEDSALYDGKTIFYYLPFAAASNATLNLTLSDETTTGEKPVFVTATTRLGTHYGAGSVISLTYLADKDGWYRSDYWNSNTYDRTYLNSPIKAATAVTAGTIIVGTASGYKMAASGVTFDLGYPILYASAAIAAAATNNATYLEIPNINLQTTKASWTGANNSIVYIVGTLSGNTVTIDSTVFTTTVPTSDDSKVYVPFGIMTSTTACYLMPMDGVYAFRNGNFGPLEPKVTVTGSGNAVTTITSTNGVITATKGITFATNGHTHTYPSLSVTTSGTGNVVDGLTVNNHAITLSKATTALLSATVSGTGNGITTASYANGVLTLTKGLTFSTNGHTHTETQLSLATSGTGNGIADLSVSNHTITMTKTSFTTGAHPTIPNLSISTSGTGNGISAISVSGHAITITKAEFTTGAIPTIPAITVATSGSGDAIIGISATNHAITATKGGSWSPSSHGLSATSTGAGNAFDTITVSNHSITMGKTTTFATTHSHPYLPLAGGTMSGVITRNGALAQSGVDNGSISMYNGTSAAGGGGIWCYGANNSNAGKVRLQAYNGNGYQQLDVNSDGTLTWKGVQLPTKYTQVGQSGNTTTNPWFKVASVINTDVANADADITFYVTDTYNSTRQGILNVHLRTDSNKYVAASASYAKWLSNSGYELENFVIAYTASTAGSVFELWTSVPLAYTGRRFTVISESSNRTTAHNDGWELNAQYGTGSASVTDGLTTKNSEDASSIPWGNVTGKPSTFSPSSHNVAVTTTTTVTGGNAVTSIAQNGHGITVTLGKKFSEDGHTHSTYLPLAGGTMSGTITGKTITATSLGIGSINIPATDTANQAKFLRGDGTWQTVITAHQSLSGYVPTSRTVNSKALSANITLTAADVGASATNHNHSGVYSPTNHTHVSANITDKMVKTAVGPAGWDVTADRGKVVDVSYMTYWNGAYSTNNASNLTYCKQGAFGTIVTKNAGDYSTSGHTHSYLPLTGGTITGNLARKNTGKTRGTAPTANVNAVEILGQDSAGKTTWGIYNTYSTAKQNQVQLIVYSGLTTDNTWAGIGIGYDGSGNVFTNAPNPAASDSSSKIATTKFVKDQGYLKTQTQLSISTSTHGGNAVTAVSVSNHAITLTKGSTFSLSNHTHSNYLATNGTAVNSTKWNNYTLATVSTSAPSLTATNTANNNKIWLQYV